MSWVDNSFFAPESLVDETGRRIMWAWLLDSPKLGVNYKNGWSGTLALPRVLSLNSKGELLLDVPDEIKALRYRPFKLTNLKELIRVRMGLITRVPHEIIHAPHKDSSEPHITGNYYLNETDGDTVIYNETTPSKEYTIKELSLIHI